MNTNCEAIVMNPNDSKQSLIAKCTNSANELKEKLRLISNISDNNRDLKQLLRSYEENLCLSRNKLQAKNDNKDNKDNKDKN